MWMCRPQSPCLPEGCHLGRSAMKKRGQGVPKLGTPAEPRRTGGRSGGLLDSESLDDRLERRPLHAEMRGRAARTAEHPVRLFQRAEDACAVDALERGETALVGDASGTPARELVQGDLERPTRREDHRALDQVRD